MPARTTEHRRDPSRFRSMGFGPHYDNMPRIRAGDVISPSIGGTGSTGLSAFLIHLGIPYGDLNRDTLHPDGSITETTDDISARVRPPGNETGAPKGGTRVLKTHLPREEFTELPARGCWILVRDPRDALYSWFKYHRAFARAEWERVPERFDDFLEMPFFMGGTPIENWWIFYQGWLDWCSRSGRESRIIRFEDLKSDPVACMRTALEITDAQVTDDRLAAAARESSYEAMRQRETRLAGDRGGGRVTRSGKVGEWKTWMTPRLREKFALPELREVAGRLGYTME